MNRLPIDEEQNRSPQDYDLREILADYWAKAAQEQPAPAPARVPSPTMLSALQAQEQEDEGVRIYQPRKSRSPRREALAPDPTLTPEPEAPAEEAAPAPAAQPRSARNAGSKSGLLAGLLGRLGKGRAPAEPEPAPAPDPAQLPSFEELLWGREKKKNAPVRIVEEDAIPAAAEKPVEQPEPRPVPEVQIPQAELTGLTVDAILSEYWGGLTEEEAPRPQRRAERREAAQEPRRAPKTKSRPRAAAPDPAPVREVPAPAIPVAPAPVIPAAPAPAPAATPEAGEHSFSVDDILSEFWAGYTEEAEAAPRAEAPRSRREAARMREEREPLPPTGAAPSAAENKRSPRRGRKNPPLPPEDEEELAEPDPRAARRGRKERKSPPPEAPARPLPPPPAPAPVSAEESAAAFSFLRSQAGPAASPREAAPPSRRENPAPRSQPAAAPARPREIIHEDVDVGAMSVDDILAEYNDILAALPEAAAAVGQEKAAEAAAEKAPEPRGSVSRMQREARSFIEEMKSENFASLREEEDYNRPAAKPAPAPSAPRLEDNEWSKALRSLLEQEPAPPQSAPAPAGEQTVTPVPREESRYAAPSEEVDPRFNLSGQRKRTMVFDGKELDLSADESYVPPKASDKVGFHWVEGEEELPDRPIEKKPLFRRKKKEAPQPEAPAEDEVQSEGFDDRKRPEYAPDVNYDDPDEERDPEAYPSFGQYLSGLFSGLLVRLLGARSRGGDAAGTMEDEDEDLGPEVSPAAASKYYGSFVLSLRMRLRIGLVLLLVMAWIALGLPVSGALRSAQVASGLVLAIQLTIMLLALDVVTGAAINLARGRFGADSLATVTCVLTSFDALAVCLGALGTPHMPLCLISSASLLGVLLSSLASARGLRKALRVPAIGKRCYGVTAEAEVKGKGLTLLKSLRPPKGFVRRAEEAAPDEDLFTRLSPVLAILALFLALIVAVAKHAYGDFLYILTVLLCPAVPFTALLAFALPYLFGSLRIFQSGAAIAGWSGVSDIGRSENLIVTDRDLFPEGSVELDTVRIFAEVEPETIISYAGTMICASGSDLAPCFAQLMEKNNCPMRRVEGFEYLAGGGMKGVIDGSVILCGGLDLMRLMNVRVPYRLVSKTTVLLAVDGILCGIFNMKYEGQPQVRKALVGLIRSNRHPIFAIRDFLVTPEMLSDCFEVATDGYDFPPYVDRFAISEAEPTAGSKLAAVVCREGLGPLVHMADTGRSMYMATRVNLLLTVLAAVIGVFTVFLRLLSVGTVGTGFLLLFLLLWALPVAAISVLLRF